MRVQASAQDSRRDSPDSIGDALGRLKQAGRPPKSPDHHGGGGGGDDMAGQHPLHRQSRHSSDSTLHRPSSAPSGRSSFESCAEAGMGGTSDPGRSARQSLDEVPSNSGSLGGGGSFGSGGSDDSNSVLQRASIAAQQPSAPTVAGTSSLYDAAPAVSGNSAGVGSGAPALRRHSASEEPWRHSAFAGISSGGRPPPHSRRRSVGKHPANLEHGSTAPPGAIDALADLLTAASEEASQDGTGGNAGGHSNAQTGPARFGPPRRSAPLPRGSPADEPLLSSQAALLAQQLLLQQQQLQARRQPQPSTSVSFATRSSSGSAAALLQQGFDSMQQRPLQQQPPFQQQQAQQQQHQHQYQQMPRSHTIAVGELSRGRTRMPSSAEMLQIFNGGGRLAAAASAAAAAGSSGLPPVGLGREQRYHSPDQSGDSQAASPFSSVQGVYGCHLLPPIDPSAPTVPELSPTLSSSRMSLQIIAGASGGAAGACRSSIDLLLDPMLPGGARTNRHSLDTLSELLLSPLLGTIGSPGVTVAQLLKQLPSSNAVHARAVREEPVVTVRRSLEEAGKHNLDEGARTLCNRSAASSRSRVVDPAASYFGHHISTSALHDIANNTVTVVAGSVPVTSAQSSRTTISAYASSMVDPAARPVAGTFEARVGTPEDSLLDPDLHDTFGAHPFYELPARPARHRHSGSAGGGGSGSSSAVAEAIAMLRRPDSGGGGNGWQHPALSGGRPPLHPGGQASRRASCEVAAAAAAAPALVSSSSSSSEDRSPPVLSALSEGAPVHQPTVYQPHQPPVPSSSAALDFSPIGHALMLEPTAVPGQHSITVHDPQIIVPSLRFLKQRALARQKLERMDQSACCRGGYIAEAKRVLAAAVHTATAQEAAVVESSCSGAIGPLLRYLRDNKHNDAALRSGLHTLSLLVSNSPNRGIIVSFHGQGMLCEAMRATKDLGIRENVVQLLWDLEAHNKECRFEPDDILALQSVLEATSNALIASHILHLMCHCLSRPDPPDMTPQQIQQWAQRLVGEIAAHKHHLQDAAQYTLGNLTAQVLGNRQVPLRQRQQLVGHLLQELPKTTNAPGQCQVVLTVLSCIVGNARVRSALAHCQARQRLMDFGQRIPDPRLRARALSLVKILHKQEQLEMSGGWYFGESEDGLPPSR